MQHIISTLAIYFMMGVCRKVWITLVHDCTIFSGNTDECVSLLLASRLPKFLCYSYANIASNNNETGSNWGEVATKINDTIDNDDSSDATICRLRSCLFDYFNLRYSFDRLSRSWIDPKSVEREEAECTDQFCHEGSKNDDSSHSTSDNSNIPARGKERTDEEYQNERASVMHGGIYPRFM